MRDDDLTNQGLFLQAFLEHTLGDKHRAGRVANDIAVAARGAGNHSLSGLTRLDSKTGEFGWNSYLNMRSETAGQFKKGEPQLTMRRFHPDFFMRRNGQLTPALSTQGLAIISQGMTFNHIREIHQMRPETAEVFMENYETIDKQLRNPRDKNKLMQIVANLLKHKQEQGELPGRYRREDRGTRDNPDVYILGEIPPGSGRFVDVAHVP
jgi:hypothetical protein